jgi:hypothetical protein
MPQTILAHMLCLMTHHQTPYRVAALLTALHFKVSQAYVEKLFNRPL